MSEVRGGSVWRTLTLTACTRAIVPMDQSHHGSHPPSLLVPGAAEGDLNLAMTVGFKFWLRVDPDDVFSSVPYEKGFYFLYYLQVCGCCVRCV